MTERRAAYLTVAGVGALYAFVSWLVWSGTLARAPGAMGAAASFDLTVTAALATWAWGSRRGRLPRRAPFVVLALGFVAAQLILPAAARDGLVVLRAAWAAVELVVIGIVVAQARQIRRRWRALRVAGVATREALEQSLAPSIGEWPARLLATELGVIGWALAGWFHPTPIEDARTYSMHRRAHYGVIVAVLLFLIGGESLALHVLVARVSVAVAWLLTASSIWAALWLLGQAHALRLQPLRLRTDGLHASVGISWCTFVPYEAIASVAPADGATRSPTTLAATVTRAADVRLTLTRPLEARGLLGRTRRFDTLLLTVDRPAELIAALQDARR